MALVNPIILQVVGYQNSGKTTFITRLIKRLTENGLKTVTIKHHGHGGKPATTKEKDSVKHLSAGAAASIVEGGGSLLLQAEMNRISLVDQIQLISYFHPDVVIIEGHKMEGYSKVLLIRDVSELPLLTKLTNVGFILYWDEKIKNALNSKTDIPFFSVHDDAGLEHIVKGIIKSKKEG